MGKQPPQSNLPKLRPFVTDTVTAKEAVTRVRFAFTHTHIYIMEKKYQQISNQKMEIPFTNTSTLILCPNERGNAVYIQDNDRNTPPRLIAYYIPNSGWVVSQPQTFEYIRERYHKAFAESNNIYRKKRNQFCIQGDYADFSQN